jgi:Secretion system C-terminal sorting domain
MIVSINPNPFPGNSSILVQSRIAQSVTLNVFDAAGKKVYGGKHNLSPGYNAVSILAGHWNAGVYFFSFTTQSGEKFVRRAIKQ